MDDAKVAEALLLRASAFISRLEPNKHRDKMLDDIDGFLFRHASRSAEIKTAIFARGTELTMQGFRRASDVLSERRDTTEQASDDPCIRCGHPNVVRDSLCHQCGEDE